MDTIELMRRVQEMGKTHPCHEVAAFFRLPYDLAWKMLMSTPVPKREGASPSPTHSEGGSHDEGRIHELSDAAREPAG